MTYQPLVRAFYKAKTTTPAQPLFRIGLVLEELEELRHALQHGSEEEVAKEMADVMYVMYGLADVMRIDLDRAFQIVHESNMSKPAVRAGKVPKGAGYVAPDMSGALW